MLGCASSPAPVALGDASTDGPRVAFEVASKGSLKQRLATADDADVVLLYGGEEAGTLDTCGCPSRPRGSIARVDGYRRALEAKRPDVPVVLVDAGNWLDDTIGLTDALREDVVAGNAAMVDGLGLARYDALAIGFRDLPYLASTAFPANAVSANIAGAPRPYVVVPAGDHKVAVTSVSPIGMTFLQPAGYTYQDVAPALAAVVPKMEAEADLVVVLAYQTGPKTRETLRAVPGIDVLVEAGDYHETYEPFVENGAVWVRSYFQTQRLGELRLKVDQGRVVAAKSRVVDLDEVIPSTGPLQALTRRQRHAVDEIQARIFPR